MKRTEAENHADDIALARYSVIAPLVCRQLTEEERARQMADILAAVHLFPDGKERKYSRRCVGRWCDYYLNGHLNADGEVVTPPGIEALRPLAREDKGVPRVLDNDLIESAIRLRKEEPSRNTAALIKLLQAQAREEGKEPPVILEATLAYHLRQRKATKKELKRASRAFRRYQHDRRNSNWQGDWSQGIHLPDPQNPNKTKLCHLHAFLDDHSRYIVYAEFYFRQNQPCLEDCFRKGILNGGIPDRVYWDNGAVYHSRQTRLIAARLGTEVIFCTPYAPEGKGKIERWFRTCKESFYPEASRAGITSLAELNEFFWGWLEREYQSRVHSETNRSPKDLWTAGASGVRFPEPARLIDLFLWEEKRKVDKAGCIKVGGNLYPVAEHLVGQEVSVRFDPFDMSKVRLYQKDQFVEVLEPQTLVNRTFCKAVPRKKEKPASLDSSKTYRKQVSEAHRERVRDTVRRARGPKSPCLSQPEFLALLQDNLVDRVFTDTEIRSSEDFFLRNAPLTEELVRVAVQRAIEAKGGARHIRYYLNAVQTARLDRRAS